MTLNTSIIFIIIAFYISSIKNDRFIPKPDTGTKCEWDGKNGTCVNYWNCLTNVIDEMDGIQPPTCDNEGNDNEVYTCCTSCYVTPNISSQVIFKEKGLWLVKNGKKSKDKCIDYLKHYKYPCYDHLDSGTVVKSYLKHEKCYGVSIFVTGNDMDAGREEFPHMALLGYGEDQESAEWLCGGSVISERFILTSGHCRSSSKGDVKFVALGVQKRSDSPSLWQVYSVDTFIPHPEYRPPSKYHDIALIRTEREISLGGPVLPACLAQGDEDIHKGDAVGWEALGHSKRAATVLQKVEVTGFSSEQCSEMYKNQGYNETTQLCYGDANVGKDTCSGNNGGPLQLDRCPHVVFGVTSSGHPCGFAGGAGLYTRVTYYVPWIESIVWP